MSVQMKFNLPPEKVRQHLSKYFGTRDDAKVRRLEASFVLVRVSGWRLPPWVDIKIGMSAEEDKTRLGINFDFRVVYGAIATLLVIAVAFFRGISLIRPENVGLAIGCTVGTLIGAPIAFALEIGKTKRKFVDDIYETLSRANK